MPTKQVESGKKVAKKRGPKPETLKIEGDWAEAVRRAMKRGTPPKSKEK